MATETMNISLPDSLKRYVEQRVAEGGYGNTSEYIRELIRHERDSQRQLLQEHLEALLLEGLDSLEREGAIEATPDYWAARRARLVAEFEAGSKSQQR